MTATPETLPNVYERQPQRATANPPAPPQPLRLTCDAASASKQISAWLAKGLALRKNRLRDLNDLDKARNDKKVWIGGYSDLLLKLFDGPAVSVACNDWVGRLLPEYAPLGLVIEQFYEEMDHRLRRLQAVVDHLDDMAGEEPAAATSPTLGEPAATPAAPKKDDVKGKSLNWARLFPTAEEMTGRTAESVKTTNVSAERTSAPTPTATTQTDDARTAENRPHAPAGALPPVVKPVGLLLVHSADEAKAVSEFLIDLAVVPRVMTLEEAKFNDPEAMVAGTTPPAFALIWPTQVEQPNPMAIARFQFQVGFLVGRLGLQRICMVQAMGKPTVDATPVTSVMLDAHGGWQLPLARTLKRAGVAVDLNRLC